MACRRKIRKTRPKYPVHQMGIMNKYIWTTVRVWTQVGFIEEQLISDLASAGGSLFSDGSSGGLSTVMSLGTTGNCPGRGELHYNPLYCLSCRRHVSPLMASSALFGNQSNRFLPVLFMETDIRRASQQARAVNNGVSSTRFTHVADLCSQYRCATSLFRKNLRTLTPC